MFDKILNEPRILERASSVTESYDDFINEAHEFDTGNWWKDGMRDHYSGKLERKELKENFIGQSQMSTFWKVSAFT